MGGKLQENGVAKYIDKAYDGKMALKMVKEAHQRKSLQYNLIFMDCSMPVQNGYESTQMIRRYC